MCEVFSWSFCVSVGVVGGFTIDFRGGFGGCCGLTLVGRLIAVLIRVGVVAVSTSGVSVVLIGSGDATGCAASPVLGVSFRP